MIVRLALRNLGRHARRTVLTVLGIGVALALMMTSLALENGAWGGMIEAAIQSAAGHVVVQAPGWQEEREVTLTLPRSSEIAARAATVWPDAVVVRRTFLGGLLTSPTGAAAVMVQGVEPAIEARVTLLDDRLAEGAWLDDDRGIVIGAELARTLQVGLGDKVVLMTQAGTDDLESRLYRVKGIFRTGSSDLDGFGGFVSFASTQELLPGDDVAHQVAVVRTAFGAGPVDAAPVRAALAGLDGLDVLTWREALPLLQEQREVDGRFSRILYGVMGVIVAIGVLNTVLMSIMERVRELGVMLALGMRPRALAAMVVVEGAALGVLGAGVGLLLAMLAAWPLTTYGIDYGAILADNMPIQGVPIDPVIRARPEMASRLVLCGIAVVMSALAALWPAWRATRLQPVEAIKHL